MGQYSDEEFRKRVEDCSWSEDFTHADHVRLAWIYLHEFPHDVAIERCSRALRGLAESHGDFDKYHHTLTVALLKLIAKAIESGDKNESWDQFVARSSRLFDSGRELIAKHYSEQRLAQDDARTTFLPPDLAPF